MSLRSVRVGLRALNNRTLSSSTKLTKIRFCLFEWPMMISRRSVSECSGSSKIRARGSANTVNGLLKRNTVLYVICFGFLGIPFKLKRHPLEILSRCSSVLSHGPQQVVRYIERSRRLSDSRPHGKLAQAGIPSVGSCHDGLTSPEGYAHANKASPASLIFTAATKSALAVKPP